MVFVLAQRVWSIQHCSSLTSLFRRIDCICLAIFSVWSMKTTSFRWCRNWAKTISRSRVIFSTTSTRQQKIRNVCVLTLMPRSTCPFPFRSTVMTKVISNWSLIWIFLSHRKCLPCWCPMKNFSSYHRFFSSPQNSTSFEMKVNDSRVSIPNVLFVF